MLQYWFNECETWLGTFSGRCFKYWESHVVANETIGRDTEDGTSEGFYTALHDRKMTVQRKGWSTLCGDLW